nr:tail fiber domain-containing protein [Saprospiraceae bacterium]
ENKNVAVGYQTLRGSASAAVNTGNENTAIGYQALLSTTQGASNTAVGSSALYSNISGLANTAIGVKALYGNVTGDFNTANGYQALYNNVDGKSNTASGTNALFANTTGQYNSAFGDDALKDNTIGNFNVAIGSFSLVSNVAGDKATAVGYGAMQYINNSASTFENKNVAVGYEALKGSPNPSTNTGNENTAIGFRSLYNNEIGNSNTTYGFYSLYKNTTGANNTAQGHKALYNNVTGSANTAVGLNALYYNVDGGNNTAIGYAAGVGSFNEDCESCTFVGNYASLSETRTNVTMLGASVLNGNCTGNDQMCLGNTAISQIRANITGITAYSDSRYKTNVEENVAGLDFILKLKPVTYNVRPKELHHIWGSPDSLANKIDHSETEQIRFIGFLAQDVEKAAQESGFNFPGIDIPRNSHEVYALRYTDFIMPMVKAMQEMHTTTIQLQSEVKSQQLLVDVLVQQNEDLLQQLNLVKIEQQQQVTELKTLLFELKAEITTSKPVED